MPTCSTGSGGSIGDEGLVIAALGLAVYGIALLVEAAGGMLASPPPGWASHGAGSPRQYEYLLAILVNRGSLVAAPLYTVAYVMFAVIHYVGSLAPAGLYSAIPLLALLYTDQNLVNQAVLALALALSIARYGSARPTMILFYLTITVSHVLAVCLPCLSSSGWLLLPVSQALRALALAMLLLLALLPRRGPAVMVRRRYRSQAGIIRDILDTLASEDVLSTTKLAMKTNLPLDRLKIIMAGLEG